MKCPGQDMQYWKPGDIFDEKCPKCGHNVEFFKDDTARRCGNCGHRFVNPGMDFGCASYCQFAEQCLGTLPDDAVIPREDLMKDRVAVEMKRYFKRDFRRIGHASRVAHYAERIGKKEGGDMGVILISAYLHDIGIPESERKYNSSAAKYQEIEGPPVARDILEKLGANEAMIDEVCDIVGHHHHPRDEETKNFQALYDADLITNLEEQHKETPIDPERLEKILNKSFFTATGREEARKALLPSGS